ncbi:MAG: nucleotidyltransferase family protein [Clostridiales bacterium]|nr:nucleotidyltransferase family protein [Clostridiales bacterium]
MKVCGIIAEYDPFHQGHLYQLNKAREITKADYMVCVLGSAFSQRGDAMMFSTHDRARMALMNGFDLVLGLPYAFSCAQANRFAMGGVGILHHLNVITHQSFGCETMDLSAMAATAHMLHAPDEQFSGILKHALEEGHSFVKAQGLAMTACLPQVDEALFSAPNFILGVSYLRAHLELKSPMIPVPVLRETDYHSKVLTGLPSASAVRGMLLKDRRTDLQGVCPDTSLDIVQKALIHPPDALDKVLLATLRDISASQMRKMPEISEGLEDRIKHALREVTSRADLIQRVKTRRYPIPRINRALTHALVGMDTRHDVPAYARLLGFHDRALPLLAAIAQAGFPLVHRPAKENRVDLSLDMKAEELWYIGSGQPMKTAWQQEIIRLQ